MKCLTLRSPLGVAFRMFAFSTLLCAMTCYRAVGYAWSRHDLLHTTYEVALESGSFRCMQVIEGQYDPIATRTPRPGWFLRIPEPLGYGDGIPRAMFLVREEPASTFRLAGGEDVLSRPFFPMWRRVTIPIWPLILLTLLPALRFARHKYYERITRRRIRRGLCTICGYDLRASPGRCPECGGEREGEVQKIPDRVAA